MDNIFTPEEAQQPVTYGELIVILESVVDNISKNAIDYSNTLQKQIFQVINTLTDSLVKIRDDAEYKRQRDVHFMIDLLAHFNHCDKEVIHKEYQRWCEEFDKLNKPKANPEDTNE